MPGVRPVRTAVGVDHGPARPGPVWPPTAVVAAPGRADRALAPRCQPDHDRAGVRPRFPVLRPTGPRQRLRPALGGRLLTAFVEVFVPGGHLCGIGGVAILLGLTARSAAIPLGSAHYFRRVAGPRLWRALHRFVRAVSALSGWHTLLYGTSTWFDGWFRTLVWRAQLPVAARPPDRGGPGGCASRERGRCRRIRHGLGRSGSAGRRCLGALAASGPKPVTPPPRAARPPGDGGRSAAERVDRVRQVGDHRVQGDADPLHRPGCGAAHEVAVGVGEHGTALPHDR